MSWFFLRSLLSVALDFDFEWDVIFNDVKKIAWCRFGVFGIVKFIK